MSSFAGMLAGSRRACADVDGIDILGGGYGKNRSFTINFSSPSPCLLGVLLTSRQKDLCCLQAARAANPINENSPDSPGGPFVCGNLLGFHIKAIYLHTSDNLPDLPVMQQFAFDGARLDRIIIDQSALCLARERKKLVKYLVGRTVQKNVVMNSEYGNFMLEGGYHVGSKIKDDCQFLE
jgi:hypothetical protein